MTSCLFVCLEFHVIFLWNFWVVYWRHNENKAVKIKGPTLLATSAFHICPYIFIPSEKHRPNKSPGNGWNGSRRHRALRLNGTLTQTDTQVVPPFSFLVTRIRNKMLLCFCFALLFPFFSDVNLQHPMIRMWQSNNWIFSATDYVLCCLNPSSLTIFTVKPYANGTFFMVLLRNGCWQEQVCRGAGELHHHAHRQSSSLHKGQQISAFISALPLLFRTVEGLNGKKGCSMGVGGGVMGSIRKLVLQPWCCWISWLCVHFHSLVACLSLWNQVVSTLP